MKNINLITGAILLAVITWLIVITPQLSSAAPNPPQGGDDADPALEQSLQEKLAGYQSKLTGADEIGFTIDNLIPSADGLSALLWLAPVDRATEEIIATEPALAIGIKDDSKALGWQIILQSDPQWSEELARFPREELPEDMQNFLYGPKDVSESALDSTLDGTVYRGYKLPWAANVSKRLSGSIGHFLIYKSCSETSCRYAYDFADGTMFPLLAAKGGDVWMAKWDCPNFATYCSNYLVIRDQSTTPTTYQLYLHMAFDSIPKELRAKGATVMQGQYIGNVDDTGYSSGHHLHFHVHTNATWYWGNSVDISFDDVAINDGEPRTCYEASNWPGYGTGCANSYISSNVGTNPGTATITAPANGAVITTSTVKVTGTTADDRGVVKVQVLGRNMGGDWVVMGEPALSGSSYAADINVCSGNLTNGLMDIAVRVFDYEGNISVPQGVRSIVKSFNCTPPPPAACAPSADQIAIYSEPNYLGVCKKLSVSSSNVYSGSSFSPVGITDIASIQVGANVRAITSDASLTYNTSGYPVISGKGRIQGFEKSDPNLADDPIGSDTIASIIVQPKNLPVAEIDAFTFPAMTQWKPATFTTQDSLGMTFYEPGAVLYKAMVQKKSGTTWVPYVELDKLLVPGASVGSLLPGEYRFLGCGETSYSGWGCGNTTPAGYEFTVVSAPFANQTVKSVPYTDALEAASSEWTTSGLWRWSSGLSEGRKGYIYNNGTNYNTGINYGSLTSPLIQVPASDGVKLSFQYRYATESPYKHWDQRWVQIAVDGGEFKNVLQLWDDPANFWLNSPAIDLSAYAGKKIRVRFFFFTIDGQGNTGTGWQIDQISVGQITLQAACSDNNSTLATAAAVGINQSITGQQICPAGDIDYFKFSGTKGDQLGIWVDAARIGSKLDPVLSLLDANGSLIYENDDQVPYEVQDSLLGVILPETGTYYLKVKAWNHPSGGGEDHPYALYVYKDALPPNIKVIYPDSMWPSDKPFSFTVEGSDANSRVMQMDFYWHPSDWQGGTWELIGSDYNGTDGWSMAVNPAELGDLKNSALYVEARDAAGNVSGDIRIAANIDSTPPAINFTPLAAELKTTAILVNVYVNDLETGLKSLVLEVREDGGAWNVIPEIAAGNNQIWYIGKQGKTYEFRVQATDNVGNNAVNSVTTRLAASCQPDSYETADGQVSGAVALPFGQRQEHNLCGLNDVDWLKFNVEAGKSYAFTAYSLGGGAAVRLELYNAAGTTQLASGFSPNLGQSAAILWKAPASGSYTIKVQPVVNGLAGTDARYGFVMGEAKVIYFPIMNK